MSEDEFEVRVECVTCKALWFIDVTRDSAYEVEDQIEDHQHESAIERGG